MIEMAIEQIDDSTLIKEVANRLLQRFKKRHGIEMKYGGFNFVIHEGKFFLVEDCLKDKSFFSGHYQQPGSKRGRSK